LRPSPALSPEKNVVRRAFARQMLAILGVDNPAIEAADAAVPCEAFLRPPPWTVSSPFTGYRPLSGCDPVCCTRT
jgi:protein-L-isoaspartate(D-aspartate) O-methyltransferase